MKKVKKMAPLESPPCAVYEDQRTKYRHKSLLQDYEELQKEMEIMRRKLQIMKQKKLMLSSEVRFFRQRYRYLVTNASLKPQPKQDFPHKKKLNIQTPIISKSMNYNRKQSKLRHSNAKERISEGAKSFNAKDASFFSSAPVLDTNIKDRIHSGKEATKKSTITPFFDLNQISREEEELLVDFEPLKVDEPRRSTQRGTGDEQHGDIKLLVCRNIGNGSIRTGKKKISWQDQVELRV